MWLTYMRKLPPTPEEIARADARRAETLRLAAEIEEEERRERSLRISREEDEFPGNGRQQEEPRANEIRRIAASVHRSAGPGPGRAPTVGRGPGTVVSEWTPGGGGT